MCQLAIHFAYENVVTILNFQSVLYKYDNHSCMQYLNRMMNDEWKSVPN